MVELLVEAEGVPRRAAETGDSKMFSLYFERCPALLSHGKCSAALCVSELGETGNMLEMNTRSGIIYRLRASYKEFAPPLSVNSPGTTRNYAPVSANRQAVAQELVGHVELVKLGVLPHALKVLQLDAQDHVFGLGQQVDVVVAKPELTAAPDKGGGGGGGGGGGE